MKTKRIIIFFTIIFCCTNSICVLGDVKLKYACDFNAFIDDNNELWVTGIFDGKTYYTFTKVYDDVKNIAYDTSRNRFYLLKTDGCLYYRKKISNVDKIYANDGNLFFIKNDGSLWGCGENEYGTIGNGNDLEQVEPIKIMDNISDVYVSLRNTMAIGTNGELYVWGNNEDYKFTRDITDDILRPIKIADNIQDIAFLGDYCIVLDNDNKVFVWGFNSSGEFGREDNTPIPDTSKELLDDVKCLYKRDGSNCVAILKNDGILYYSGTDHYNILGEPVKNYNEPVEVEKDVKDSLLAILGKIKIKKEM